MKRTTRNQSRLEEKEFLGRTVVCRTDELRPHPSYVRHNLTVPAFKLSALAECTDLTMSEPLVITPDHTIIDGYARWELARLQGRPTLPCFVCDVRGEQSLLLLLQRHRQSDGLNAFCRILLALDLEPSLREKSRLNQRIGAQGKGSPNLTEADRLDVRREIAKAAGVSAGNVTKVKKILLYAISELQDALRGGELSIHRAWQWVNRTHEQQGQELWNYREERGLRRTIGGLISRHLMASTPDPTVVDLARGLAGLDPNQMRAIRIVTIKASGKTLVLTEELFELLNRQGELEIK